MILESGKSVVYKIEAVSSLKTRELNEAEVD